MSLINHGTIMRRNRKRKKIQKSNFNVCLCLHVCACSLCVCLFSAGVNGQNYLPQVLHVYSALKLTLPLMTLTTT